MPSGASPLGSRSPPRQHDRRQSLSEHLSNLGTKFGRALSVEKRDPTNERRQTSPADRSQSRGREHVLTRSGLGSARTPSQSYDPDSEPKEHSVPRGRGAVRNVPGVGTEDEDGSLGPQAALHSTGRGGFANITSLRSPSVESPHPHDCDSAELELVSVGRGGAGNIRSRSRSQVRSAVESHPHVPTSNMISTGRGGVGNIRDRSKSQARGEVTHAISERNSSVNEHETIDGHADTTAHKHGHGLEGLLHKVVHHDHKD